MGDSNEEKYATDKEFVELTIRVEKFISTVENWMDTTKEYRLSLCEKIDEVRRKVDKLPCDHRASAYESFKGQMALIWIVISGVIIKIFYDWISK